MSSKVHQSIVLLPFQFSCNDGFSLFNELSKQWDMQYSTLDAEITPTSDKKVQISDTKSSFSSDCPTVVTANSSLESPIVSKNDRMPTSLNLEKSPKPQIETPSNQSSNQIIENSKPTTNNNPAVRSSSFFTKIRTFGTTKAPKPKEPIVNTEPVNSSTSPLYAKIKKANKVKKPKEVNTKKNIISNPILISAPVVNSVNIMEENYLDCSSEGALHFFCFAHFYWVCLGDNFWDNICQELLQNNGLSAADIIRDRLFDMVHFPYRSQLLFCQLKLLHRWPCAGVAGDNFEISIKYLVASMT